MKIAIAGVSGYLGGELFRLLAAHPNVEVAGIFGNDSTGKRISDVHPGFPGDMKIENLADIQPENFDVVFSAMPNGETAKHWNLFKKSKLFIDTSSDFRLKSADAHEKYYEQKWNAASKDFVYGLPELFRSQIRKARYVASPGCFATSVILGLFPIVSNDLNKGTVYVSSVTGSSGSGAKPKEKTHHPFRSDSFFAYEPLKHRHTPEILQAVGKNCEIAFQAHSAPFVRGIHTTIMFECRTTNVELLTVLHEQYANEPFVKIVDEAPNVKWVKGTNVAHISCAQNGKQSVVFVAIDNLLKGGSGQALQCMNIALGLDEAAGLPLIGAVC